MAEVFEVEEHEYSAETPTNFNQFRIFPFIRPFCLKLGNSAFYSVVDWFVKFAIDLVISYLYKHSPDNENVYANNSLYCLHPHVE
ncbi:unnamed protein product [Onchocerca flexuosa]|uniref:Ovule protein n=1 Tax=Onchocerca flexuosa TaxID=387005 RepID=A0A183I7K0_9BILA|nr:unnamed protein product [Onchocerca flexuosa]